MLIEINRKGLFAVTGGKEMILMSTGEIYIGGIMIGILQNQKDEKLKYMVRPDGEWSDKDTLFDPMDEEYHFLLE